MINTEQQKSIEEEKPIAGNETIVSERRDRLGQEIKSQSGKRHKVTFRDDIMKGEKVSEVILVESYKKYNLLTASEKGDNIKCLIF